MEDARIEAHKKFWNHEKNTKPLVSFRIGTYFFASHYRAAEKLLTSKTRITPDMIDVDSFMEDYERMYNDASALGQSGFWTAEPYTGIPWMEAFWGCEIIATGESFVALPYVKEVRDFEKLQFSMENPWVAKYFEFVVKLNDWSQGRLPEGNITPADSQHRFPVGAPILRGQGDTVGALMGQTEFIYALYEEPDIIRKILRKVVDSFLYIYEEMHRLNKPFHGGSSMGFYHVWAPGKSLWFQEDIGALLSPPLYRDFFLENERYFCSKYKYNMMHLHSSSFHLLDDILCNENLKALEINKDENGLSVEQMLPHFRKILRKKLCLVIWGNLNEKEIQLVCNNMPLEGVFFNMVPPDFVAAERIHTCLNSVISV